MPGKADLFGECITDLFRQTEDPQDDRFVCLWSPCKSSRTFGRVAELQRHYEEQHVRSKVFDCMAVGCPAKGLKGLTRADKLAVHLETHHSKNTPLLCPAPQCSAGPFLPALLFVHLHWHTRDVRAQNHGQLNCLAAMSFPCPVQSCNKNLGQGDHDLEHHNMNTRMRDALAILAAGYSPTSGLPICPVCKDELTPVTWSSDSNTQHFLSHDWESLYAHRSDILKVWILFGTIKDFQQVFEDILPLMHHRYQFGLTG